MFSTKSRNNQQPVASLDAWKPGVAMNAANLLPQPLTSLVGREREVDRLRDLLRRSLHESPSAVDGN